MLLLSELLLSELLLSGPSRAAHSPVMEKRNSGWGWMWGCSTVQGARVICREGGGGGEG